MYEKIVIALDLSEAISRTINCVQDLKKIGATEIILFQGPGFTYNEVE